MANRRKLRRSERNIRWIEAYCRLPAGSPGYPAGTPVRLTPEQKKWMRRVYDSPTRTWILSIGRKNAKTAFVAMLLLLHLAGPESRQNSELCSTAQSRDQAAKLFAYAAKMVLMSPDLNAYITIKTSTKELICEERGTEYKALSSEAKTKYGANPAFAVHDELGQVVGPTSDLYDAIETAQGAQEEPLSIIISTQASTDGDLLSLLIDDALLGADPMLKVDLYTFDPDLETGQKGPKVDPYSDKAIRMANPHFDIFMNKNEVRSQAKKAQRMPSFEGKFRNLTLNQRVNRYDPYMSRSVFEACSGPIDPALFRDGRLVYSALDLSARNDLTSRVDVIEDPDGNVQVACKFWAPEVGVADREKRDRVPYQAWAKQGFLILTPGVTVDYAFVAKDLADDLGSMRFAEVAYDRWRMDHLIAELRRLDVAITLDPDDGSGALVLRKFGQGFQDMAPALDETEALYLARKVRHGGNPILRWQSWNTVAVKNPAGDRKLDKSKTSARIDGFVAKVMAIARLRSAQKPGKSFWEIEAQAA